MKLLASTGSCQSHFRSCMQSEMAALTAGGPVTDTCCSTAIENLFSTVLLLLLLLLQQQQTAEINC